MIMTIEIVATFAYKVTESYKSQNKTSKKCTF